MIIQAITFKRKEESKIEVGIIIEADKVTILDTKGKEIKKVFSYDVLPYHLTLDLTGFFKELKEKCKSR